MDGKVILHCRFLMNVNESDDVSFVFVVHICPKFRMPHLMVFFIVAVFRDHQTVINKMTWVHQFQLLKLLFCSFACFLIHQYIHTACHKVVNKLEALCLNSHVSIIAQTSSSVDVMSFGFNFNTIARMHPGAYSWWCQTSSESPNQALHVSV